MKRITALILFVLFASAVLPAAAFAASEFGSDEAFVLPFSGSGTEQDPYLIGSAEELIELSDLTNEGNGFSGVFFALSDDIDVSGLEWTPIGADAEHPFAGSFSGAGHSVSGLFISSGRDYAALFGVSRGDIEGLYVLDAHVEGGEPCAAVLAYGAARNCFASGEVTGSSRVGGVIGEGTAYFCESACAVVGTSRVGGVIGEGDAYSCSFTGAVTGLNHAGRVSGLGVLFECEDGRVPETPAKQYSVTEFLSWGLTHADPASVPTNASLVIANALCGQDPWAYLYGSIRAAVNEATLNHFFENHYTTTFTRTQYNENTATWTNISHATDCQGLLDAWLTYEQGSATDYNCQMNYRYWCTDKGTVEEIARPYVIGEALFIYSPRLGRMGHVGWICGFDEDGEPLVLEAKGFMHGVIISRLCEGKWTHRGLMTVKFDYDCTLSGTSSCVPEKELPRSEKTAPAPEAEVWDGVLTERYAGGSGTALDPYLISTASQLVYLAYEVRTGTAYEGEYFALTSDIFINDTSDWTSWTSTEGPANAWIPIGVYNSDSSVLPFKGSFDGRGHTVHGLYCSSHLKSGFGLFGYVGGNAAGVIKNVSVAESYINVVNNAGGIVGYMTGYGRIENCSFSGIVDGDYFVGGIVGYAVNSSAATSIVGCVNFGTVSGSTEVGGIVGCAKKNTVLTDCRNAGPLVRGYRRTGGVAGKLASSILSRCRSDGPVRGMERAGGLCGLVTSSEVRESYCGGRVDACYYLGGIIGYVTSSAVKNCFNAGPVSGLEYAGGLVGRSSLTSFTTSYNVGSVSAWRNKGGAAAHAEGSTFANVIYMSGCVSGSSSYGVSVSGYSLLSSSGYPGFDFVSVFTVNASTDYPFAELIRVPYTSLLIPETPSQPTPAPTPPPAPTFSPITIPPLMPTPSPVPLPPGDADGSGAVEIGDALLILRICMGLVSQSSLGSHGDCDMNGDGSLTLEDSLIILRTAMGLLR